jgi:hypothetical protein
MRRLLLAWQPLMDVADVLKIVFAPFSNYVGEFETLRDSSNHFQEK